MEELYEYLSALLAAVPDKFTRYINPQIPWGSRMFGLVGPRGVGKTTLFLQRIKHELDGIAQISNKATSSMGVMPDMAPTPNEATPSSATSNKATSSTGMAFNMATLSSTTLNGATLNGTALSMAALAKTGILYISADHLYFANHSLYDTAKEFVQQGGKELLIDEIHKYPRWSRELKLLYDGFPDLSIAFTGSSVLDITQGESDLSRRAPIYMMQGLSFREYLQIAHQIEAPCFTLQQILDNEALIPGVQHPLAYFNEYLQHGYYPFAQGETFTKVLDQIVAQTLEVDIPQYADMNAATAVKLKHLMAIIAQTAPFKPNMTKLASQVGASRNNIETYLMYMEKAGMIARLKTASAKLGGLGKVSKVYLDNPNLLSALGGEAFNKGTLRETFFFNQMRVNHEVCASEVSDFQIDDITFEIGGRSKTSEQLKGVTKGYVVKDDIEVGYGKTVPLWAFGLNY